jgi:tripartite-type tricarboxylate transporter receptor subunit TctC
MFWDGRKVALRKKYRDCGVVLLMLALAQTSDAGAQTKNAPGEHYPSKPVRFIVGFPPGGAADIIGRLTAVKLSEALGTQVVVDNRGGAGGLLATEIAARAPADGYTLMLTSIPHAINPALYKKVQYDPIRDFTPVIELVSAALLLAVTPSLPAKSVKELIALARARNGQLNYASAGSGSSSHLAMELFKLMAGVEMQAIPYKGTGPLITELIAGQVSVTIASAVPLIPQVKAGKLRGLAVTTPKRAAAMPDLPTIAESGVPGYDVTNWFGVIAPAGTAPAIVTRLNRDLDNILRMPDVKERFAEQGAETVGGTPQQFDALIRSDVRKWADLVKRINLRVE